MCGLFAWWPKTPAASDLGHVRDALHSLRDRGPDDEGLWVHPDQRAYMGHRRLKITGERGRQPLWSPDRTVMCIVNGEFYDLNQRRAELSKQGYVFQTDSDSELVLAIYHVHGVAGLPILEGEFAFVLWDMGKDLVWAARDRAGIKPLRFIHDERGLAFSSEAKAFFEAGWKAKWDQQSLAQALTVQYPDPARTLFEGVQQLAPGESALFTRQRNEWSTLRWWWWEWFPTPDEHLQSPSSAAAALDLDEALKRAVNRRTDTPWPLAVHLSAGLDSTAILAATVQTRAEGVHAFSVGFEPPDDHSQVMHDECIVAQATAKTLRVPWTRVEATRPEMLRHWADAVYRAEGIGINGHLVAKWLLARQVHNAGFRVCLSGEGADEALLGYAFLSAEAVKEDEAERAKIQANNPVARGIMLPEGEEVDLSAVEQAWGFVPVWLHAKASLGARLQGLMKPKWKQEICPAALESWATATRPEKHRKPVHGAAASWARLALGGYILPSLADAPEAAWHIQGRVPFLDRDLLETVMSWSPQTAGCPHRPKAPLRDWLISQGLENIATRPKHPFQAPPLWGSQEVRESLRARWSEPGRWQNTPFDADKVIACMNHLDAVDAPERQTWEPVIATLLSVDHLVEQFNLELQA
jgi:asparagine synthase (glutamine-hydrolysing)